MRSLIRMLAGVAAIVLTTAGIAQAAAAPPAASTDAAVNITRTTAVLRAHVNPRKTPTNYAFNYGTTTAYGLVTTARSAGSGRGPVLVRDQITGLLPGTVYHYQVTATSATGTVLGADVTFTTKGAPPSTATTGPAADVGKTVATVGGTVGTNGANTDWSVQYGTSTSYGATTNTEVLPASANGSGVAVELTGLAPATLFHYRLVTSHGGDVSYGADATFFTQPDNPPSPDLKTKTTPKTDKTTPFEFTTSGTLNGGQFIPAGDRCSGQVAIRYFNGKHQLGYKIADVSTSCTFSTKVSFKKLDGNGPAKLRVSVFYRGNGYLHTGSKTDHPVAGKSHSSHSSTKK